VVVADTGAIVGLVDSDDAHHAALKRLYERDPDDWILPWAILPEVDYLLGSQVSRRAQEAFLADVGNGSFRVEWGRAGDLTRAGELDRRYRSLRLGLVDAVVMATYERLGAEAIATLDLRHFGAVTLKIRPKLLPRDA
jgi:predicted nucleic acid-binding protein